MSYAEGTTVSAAKSRAEIEDMLTRAGATRFMTSIETGRAVIMFELKGRAVKFEIAFPTRDDKRFTHAKPRGRWSSPTRRSEPAAAAAHDAECRRLWRCLALAIKSKLSAYHAEQERIRAGLANATSEAEIKAVFDLDAVQALLGHHTKSMAEHYGGVMFKKAAEVAKARAPGG